MAEINLTDEKGRDAVVAAESATFATEYRWIDEEQQQVGTRKILRATMTESDEALIEKAGGLDEVAELLIESDDDVDLEIFGKYL
ncbi:MAG: hypothetical protein HKN23_00630, partial [Verrucomicrobiales bacterium]|nr:hypothetical protein [Verrucomicrobiales bacterium]